MSYIDYPPLQLAAESYNLEPGPPEVREARASRHPANSLIASLWIDNAGGRPLWPPASFQHATDCLPIKVSLQQVQTGTSIMKFYDLPPQDCSTTHGPMLLTRFTVRSPLAPRIPSHRGTTDRPNKPSYVSSTRPRRSVQSAVRATRRRIATFDQDGTLWVEHPMYTQVMYCFHRVPAAGERETGIETSSRSRPLSPATAKPSGNSP